MPDEPLPEPTPADFADLDAFAARFGLTKAEFARVARRVLDSRTLGGKTVREAFLATAESSCDPDLIRQLGSIRRTIAERAAKLGRGR